MLRVLVTGVNGFVGKHLARELKNRGLQVAGVGQQGKLHPSLVGVVDDFYMCDLTKSDDVARIPLDEFDSIINLAGLSRVGDSFKNPEIYNQINVGVLAV